MLLGCKLDFYVRNKQFSVLKNMDKFMCLKKKGEKKREKYSRCVDIVINKNEQVEIMESENENRNV